MAKYSHSLDEVWKNWFPLLSTPELKNTMLKMADMNVPGRKSIVIVAILILVSPTMGKFDGLIHWEVTHVIILELSLCVSFAMTLVVLAISKFVWLFVWQSILKTK